METHYQFSCGKASSSISTSLEVSAGAGQEPRSLTHRSDTSCSVLSASWETFSKAEMHSMLLQHHAPAILRNAATIYSCKFGCLSDRCNSWRAPVLSLPSGGFVLDHRLLSRNRGRTHSSLPEDHCPSSLGCGEMTPCQFLISPCQFIISESPVHFDSQTSCYSSNVRHTA